MLSQQETVFTQAQEKGDSVTGRIYYNRGEKLSSTHGPVGQKILSSTFSKYEIHKGWHLYRIHKKADTHQCTCR